MKGYSKIVIAALSVIAVLLLETQMSAAEANVPTAARPADLVTAALKTELEGPTETRKQLLDEALRRDPNFAPARWQSGFVRWNDEWIAIDDMPRRARSIEHLAEYRKKRGAMVETADNHRDLARWCRKNKLLDESRVHWAKVLEFEHTDAEAIEALGLQLYNGRLLTKAQLDAEKEQVGEARRAMKRWQPQFVKWRKAVEHGGPRQLDEALRGLKDVSDASAIPALEIVFAVNGEVPRQVELNKLLIETVGRMPVPEATQVLLRRSIIPDSVKIRAAAAAELKKRPMFTYVPILTSAFRAALPPSFEVRFQFFFVPPLAVLAREELSIEGRDFDVYVSRDFLEMPQLVREHGNVPIDWNFVNQQLSTYSTTRFAQLAAIEKTADDISAVSAERHRQLTAEVKDRFEFALRETTGFEDVTDPDLWEKQYNEYYDWYYSPNNERKQYQMFGTSFGTVPILTSHSCFCSGTPVATMAGSMPIEKIKVGDRVLAQDPLTGELAFKTVQATTVRPAMPVIRLGFGADSIRATRGHPFWLNGFGWQVAKTLTTGDCLHSLDGACVVKDVERIPDTEVYNLVVSDWHTYFVGNSRLLVHDNSPIQEPTTLVPGLVKGVAPVQSSAQRSR
jgi:hypothetical protein